ncbi:MAG: restriction endonuclease [Burkholderiaceae bacterium]
MAIPDFQSLMLPVLKESAAGEVRISDVVAVLGAKLALTNAELSELLPSGKQTTFANRVNWAKSYLGKAGLIRLTKRAYFEISERGRAVLAMPPQTINIKFLESFPEFKAFRDAASDTPTTPRVADPTNFKVLAPDEVIRSASDELHQSLSAELLAKILSAPPDFFERLVVQLLVAMGYGGSAIEAGRALGKSGDDGVDGVIDQDALGLDRIYVQAKRYTDNKVSSGEIRDFFGSLDRFKANKGLFVTTSTFSPAAKETAEMLSKRIVLIDAVLLTRLMIRFDIGCRVEELVYIKKLDEDFFD